MSPESVTFTNTRGQKLAGVLHGAVGQVAVITCHGMFSSKDGVKQVLLADQLEHHQIATLRFDFAGRGSSEGSLRTLTVSNQMEDLDSAINYLTRRGVQRFGLFGSSLGGATALLTAARDERVVAVATMAAVCHLATLFEQQAEQWPTTAEGSARTEHGLIDRTLLDDAREHDVLSAVAVLHAPVLVIHGDADELVPCSDAHDIATTARNASLEMVSGVGHRFDDPTVLRPLISTITQFFVDNLLPASA